MRVNSGLLAGLVAAGFFALAGPSYAQSVQVLGDYRDWSAYTASESSGRLCFAMSEPTSTAPEPEGYSDAYLYLSTRVSDGVRDEFNLIAGYEFAPDTTAQLEVGGQVYELFTQADGAWLQDATLGQNLAGNVRAGTTLTVTGTSARGIRVVQTFSLSGATAASRAVEQAC